MAFNSNQQDESDSPYTDTSFETERSSSRSEPIDPLPSEWPLVANETFTTHPSGWAKGNFPDENIEWFDINTIQGKYRFDMKFLIPRQRWIVSPYNPSADIYVAVDIKFVEFTTNSVSASLLFGKTPDTDYSFYISPNSNYCLGIRNGPENKLLLNWTDADFNPEEFNRIAVSVENQHMKLYINSKLVGTFRDPLFKGGKVGITVTGYQKDVLLKIDFDNFEYRYKQ